MIVCPNCGASNAEGSRFCSNCGTRLQDMSQAAPAAVVPAAEPAPNEPAPPEPEPEAEPAPSAPPPPSRPSIPPPVASPLPPRQVDRSQLPASSPEWRMSDPGPLPERRGRRRWLWIVLGVVGACLLVCVIFTIWTNTESGGRFLDDIQTAAAEAQQSPEAGE